jgi:predicted RNA-binding protein YlqC (UPF0109 family)
MNGYLTDVEVYVKRILSGLIDSSDFFIVPAIEEGDLIRIEVVVSKKAMGALLGRGGDTIQCVRKVVAVMASRYTKRAWVNVKAETGDSMSGTAELIKEKKDIDIFSMKDLDFRS